MSTTQQEKLSMFEKCEKKMVSEGMSGAAVAAFKNSYLALLSGESGMIAESSIAPATDVPALEEIQKKQVITPALLKETVVLKLNGGLGTGMGLDKAKSLLTVKGQDSFLDLTCKQVQEMRKQYGNVKFMLMNSFSTSKDTLDFLEKYPELRNDESLFLMKLF